MPTATSQAQDLADAIDGAAPPATNGKPRASRRKANDQANGQAPKPEGSAAETPAEPTPATSARRRAARPKAPKAEDAAPGPEAAAETPADPAPVVPPTDTTPAAADSTEPPGDPTEPEVKELPDTLNRADVDRIVALEAEADTLVGEADNIRAQAAALIVKQLDNGASERQVAAAIGKSDSHVHFAAAAWRRLQDPESAITDFQTAYKLAKAKKSDTTAGVTGPDSGSDQAGPDESAEAPFPAWAKQVRDLRRLVPEMIDQANYNQIKKLANMLERFTREALSKEQDLEILERATNASQTAA